MTGFRVGGWIYILRHEYTNGKSQYVFAEVLFMGHTPFLKDALYLRPETEAVEKLLEGLPREIIWLESLWLEEIREDCVLRYGEKEKEGGFRDTLILLTISRPLSGHLPTATHWNPIYSHFKCLKKHKTQRKLCRLRINMLSKAPDNIDYTGSCGSAPLQCFPTLCVLLFNQQEAPEYNNTKRNADWAVCTIWSLIRKAMSCDSKLIFRKDCTD